MKVGHREQVGACGQVAASTGARWWPLAAAALAMALLVPAPATAAPPVRSEFPITTTVEDEGEACGFPVRWEISGHARQTVFLDDHGNPTKVLVHVRENNIVTNLDTGVTIRDTPVFSQTVLFRDDGTVAQVETTGRYVDAGTGRDRVLDVGRVVIAYLPDGGRELLHESGIHPLRDVTLLTGDPAGLAIFCEALS